MHENLDFYKATEDDLESIFNIIDITGWGETIEDIERVLKNQSNTYVSVVDRVTGEMIGITLAVANGELGFIGHVIVKPKSRGMGIGEELMNEAIDILKFKGIKTIKLDAVATAKSLYERVGFKFELNSLRYQFEITDKDSLTNLIQNLKSHQQISLSKIEEHELKQIFEVDNEIFEADRHEFLLSFIEDYPDLAYVAKDSNEKITGYCFGSYQNGFLKLRAGISDSPDIAIQLLSAMVSVVQEKPDFKFIKLGILENNMKCIELLEKIGFKKTSFSLRMFRGKKSSASTHQSIFAIGDPAKG